MFSHAGLMFVGAFKLKQLCVFVCLFIVLVNVETEEIRARERQLYLKPVISSINNNCFSWKQYRDGGTERQRDRYGKRDRGKENEIYVVLSFFPSLLPVAWTVTSQKPVATFLTTDRRHRWYIQICQPNVKRIFQRWKHDFQIVLEPVLPICSG